MKRLFLDADACPVIEESLTVARSLAVPVIIVGNYTQNMRRFEGEQGVEIIEVETERDEADFVIFSRIEPNDVLVTGDTGLAALVLDKRVSVITPRGRVFRNEAIDRELNARHEARMTRVRRGRIKGPPPFTREDRERFETVLQRVLSRNSCRIE